MPEEPLDMTDFASLLASIIQGEAAPSDDAMVAVARCLAECLKRGDDQARTAQRWKGRDTPTDRARELAAGILAGTVQPSGYYYCMSQTDVDDHGWVDGDLVVRAGVYANHLYAEWPRKRGTGMNYPKPANGSKRGVHWNASNYPLFNNWQWFVNECREMKLGWIKMLSNGGASPGQGDSGLELATAILRADMMPVVRFYCDAGHRWTDANSNAVDAYVKAGVRYIETINEPDLAYEWDGGRQPKDWATAAFTNWIGHAQAIIAHGGIPLSPSLASGFMQARGEGAGQLTTNPFKLVKAAGIPYFVCSVHNYQLNHPWNYPDDDVNQHGTPLTREEYDRWGGAYAWDGQSIETINEWRRTDANPGKTIRDDDSCFRAVEIFRTLLDEAGYPDVPVLTTEGGWAACLTDRQDRRYPRVTPQWQQYQAEQCIAYMAARDWYLGGCPWLLGQWKMGGHSGWEPNAWYTDMHNQLFGLQGVIPLVPWLKARPLSADGASTPPPVEPPPVEPPAEEEEPEVPLPPVLNDAASYGVRIVPANVTAGETYWRIVKVHHLTPEENNGNHHLYADVLSKTGQRINGAVIAVAYPDNRQTRAVVDKPNSEPGTNVPLYGQDSVRAWVESELDSDRIEGIHTRHPDEGPVTGWGHPGNANGHHSFLVEWREAVAAGETEPEPPDEPDPPEPPDPTTSTTTTGRYELTEIFQGKARIKEMLILTPDVG